MINNCTRRDCYFWSNDGNDMHYCNFINCQYIKIKDVKFEYFTDKESNMDLEHDMRNEELLFKMFKQKYNLTEEQSDEIISIVKASFNKRFDDNCVEMINVADKLNTKYAGKIVFFNQYEAGGWICNCQRVVYDVNTDCIRFEGSRFVLLSENHDIGYGYALVEAYADDGAEYYCDGDYEDELEILESIDAKLEILESIDDVKEILEGINEFSLDEF